MPIKIKSTSGSVTLSAENVSGDQTLTVPSQASATLQTTADTITSSRLTGALPAISGASLTSLTSGNLTGALPAISGASLTGIDSLPSQSSQSGKFLTTDGTTASWNTVSAGVTTTLTATSNIGLGVGAVDSITTGDYNVGLGDNALTGTTTGGSNIAIGHSALDANTTAHYNIAVGSGALGANTTGSPNLAIGYLSLATNTTAAENVAIGNNALELNTTGAANTAVGRSALTSNTTGQSNIAIGRGSGDNITTGSNNIIIGSDLDALSATKSHQLNVGKMYFACADAANGANTALQSGTYAPVAPDDLEGGETANSIIYSGDCGSNFVNGCAANTWHMLDVFDFNNYGSYHNGRGFLVSVHWYYGVSSRGHLANCRIFMSPFSANTSSGYATGPSYSMVTNGGASEHGVEAVVSMHTTCPGGRPNIQFRHQISGTNLFLQIYSDLSPINQNDCYMRVRSL